MKNATADKVGEAEYFLSMMKQMCEDDKLFAYKLSAFLSAARTITWYMQKQYKHRDGFAQWYCQKQIELTRIRCEAIEKIGSGLDRRIRSVFKP